MGRIVSDPAVLRGKPIIKGTRISVELVVSFIDGGQSPEQIVDDFPELTLADIDAAITFDARNAQSSARAS
ncbi:MAG: DUF433 domain-containing protein [Thermomicrobiales bacterium]|nr:DUF433 domain-containing protein [Thermomicrobiales bacterium]